VRALKRVVFPELGFPIRAIWASMEEELIGEKVVEIRPE
jgi:hypothetical protein